MGIRLWKVQQYVRSKSATSPTFTDLPPHRETLIFVVYRCGPSTANATTKYSDNSVVISVDLFPPLPAFCSPGTGPCPRPRPRPCPGAGSRAGPRSR